MFRKKTLSAFELFTEVPSEHCHPLQRVLGVQRLLLTKAISVPIPVRAGICNSGEFKRVSGKTDAAKLFEVLNTTPARASRIRQTGITKDEKVIAPHLPKEALALFVSTKLTKAQYQKLRIEAKSKNSNIYSI